MPKFRHNPLVPLWRNDASIVVLFYVTESFQSAQHLYEKREGSGAGSVPLTNGSGSGRPKNIRIRIPNTVFNSLTGLPVATLFLIVIVNFCSRPLFLCIPVSTFLRFMDVCAQVGGKDHVHCLLPPLESLATVEETIVRDKVGYPVPSNRVPVSVVEPEPQEP